MKMLPLHHGSGCRQYTTVILPRKSCRMRRTVRPIPASPDASLGFLLVGAVVLIPIIVTYTAYAYWVFRGKVDPSEGYH